MFTLIAPFDLSCCHEARSRLHYSEKQAALQPLLHVVHVTAPKWHGFHVFAHVLSLPAVRPPNPPAVFWGLLTLAASIHTRVRFKILYAVTLALLFVAGASRLLLHQLLLDGSSLCQKIMTRPFPCATLTHPGVSIFPPQSLLGQRFLGCRAGCLCSGGSSA